MCAVKHSGFDDYEHWIDAHCHLCNEPLSDNLQHELEAARRMNINTFISTALTRKEIDWHLANYCPEIKLVAGVHPFYEKSSSEDIPYLEKLCEEDILWGIGEIGFDNRKNNHKYQQNILSDQLELAQQYDLPVVFHVVRRFNELYQLLSKDFPEIKGYIHGFTGSPELVEMLSRLNIAFSLGHRILQQKDAADTIKRIIKNGLYLFETDAPFLPVMNKSTKENSMLCSLNHIVSEVSEVSGVKIDELLEGQWETFNAISKP